ncbi:MAG: 2,5-diketo-D-gluconate reductase [Cryptosporangiaceae bacterium]|nr:2,5-diketo-D-gluconate reductase [Cryptosporangiaceae bacterium]
MADVPALTLNNGVTIPQVGFGVFQVPDAQTAAAVAEALALGYRHIDTATLYRNERSVGQAIRESGIPREEIFVTTKLWNTDQGHDKAGRAFAASLDRLGLDYVDLYLIHWPVPAANRYTETWAALEKLLADGRTRAIGVSNFEPAHLERLFAESSVVPAVNQIELHPYLGQRRLREVHAEHGIVTESWSPIARGGQGGLLTDPVITAIAGRIGRTPAQVILRWHVQHGLVPLPRSVTPSRIAENLDVFSFALTDDDIVAIDGLDRDGRIGPHPAAFNR